nr:hypothetical protein [uncultured Roseateles sp.]
MSGGLMIPGCLHDFGGGRAYILPPLSLGALELLHERMKLLPTLEVTDPVAVATVIDATHIALCRNYPMITRVEVAELVDVGNMGDVYESLMDISGAKRKAQAAGNLQAMSPSIGEGSSPASAPTPAGPGPTSEST